MTDVMLLFAITLSILAVAVMGFKAGWDTHKMRSTPITIQSIEEYINTKFPTRWAAYKQGVNEGYEQGLRDGQEIPDEHS